MIALDAMGGDFAPEVTVRGAVNAAQKGVHVGLFGDQGALEGLLAKTGVAWQSLPISIIHCSQTIDMGDEPSRSVLNKKDASLVRAVQAVVDGTATAVVSAGNSGAALVAGTLLMGRIDGILRPALGNFIPTLQGSLFCLDLGANTDCKPEYLEQFALMGALFVRAFCGIKEPRIALLSNGAEPYKGSLVVKQAYALLEKSPLQFVGNLEARDMFGDRAEVLVCDGFVGNVMLKTMQGTAATMTTWLKQEGQRNWWRKFALALNAPVLKHIRSKVDYANKGGALFLGLKQPFIVAHGCSSAFAIERALIYAQDIVHKQVMIKFNKDLHAYMQLAMAQVAPLSDQTQRLSF